MVILGIRRDSCNWWSRRVRLLYISLIPITVTFIWLFSFTIPSHYGGWPKRMTELWIWTHLRLDFPYHTRCGSQTRKQGIQPNAKQSKSLEESRKVPVAACLLLSLKFDEQQTKSRYILLSSAGSQFSKFTW